MISRTHSVCARAAAAGRGAAICLTGEVDDGGRACCRRARTTASWVAVGAANGAAWTSIVVPPGSACGDTPL